MTLTWREASQRLDPARVATFCAAQWGGDPSSLQLVNIGINAVYRFTVGGVGHYLRLSHVTMRSLAHWQAATDYLAHLARHNAPVCRPVPSFNGRLINELQLDELTFWGGVITEVPGDLMHAEHDDLRPYAAWGRSLGALHAAAQHYVPGPDLPFKHIDGIWERVRLYAERNADPAVRAAFETIDVWQRDLPRVDMGITHGDHRPGNVLWDGTTAHIVDFDEPVMHWFLSDIARAMLAFSDQPRQRRAAVRDAFLDGYRAVRPLDPRWDAELARFMQWRGLLMHLWDLEFIARGEDDDYAEVARRWALMRFTW